MHPSLLGSLSLFHRARAAGSGRWEKLKSERSCAKLRFDFLPAAHALRGIQGGRDRHSHNVVEKFEFSSRRPSIPLIQAMLFNMGVA